MTSMAYHKDQWSSISQSKYEVVKFHFFYNMIYSLAEYNMTVK